MADVKAKVKTPKKKASKREKKDWIAAYILIAPVTLGLLVFYIWPFIQNVWDRPSDPPGRSDRGCISICMDDPDII